MADGGAGGDGGAAQREQAEQTRRASAIDRINSYFGLDPAQKQVANPSAPAQGRFVSAPTTQGTGGPGTGTTQQWIAPTPGPANMMDNPLLAEAATNKTARNDIYAGVKGDVLDLNLKKLSEYADEAARARSFGLARKGQTGSSVDIDSEAAFRRKYDDSARDASAMADSAAVDFKTSDEQSRLNLINQINAGGDVNTALQSGINALSLNADNARAGTTGRVIGNTFGDLATQYAYGQDLQGRTAAAQKYALNRGLTPTNTSYTGRVS